MSAATFTVYVETNWLVSCVLLHHDWHADARSLLDAAEAGGCVLRIPKVAFLEARHVVERETKDHAKAVSAVSASFTAAARNLKRTELSELARRVKEAEASYHLDNPRRELDATPPAAVLSANSHEFSVTGSSSKLPRDFYASRRMVYNDKFDLPSARRAWTSADQKGWPAPVSPTEDARLKEAYRLLLKLPEGKRDAALEGLRKLSDSG